MSDPERDPGSRDPFRDWDEAEASAQDGPEGPADAAEALDLARRHARRAVVEALEALRALLDAASLAATGRPSDASLRLAPVASLLEDLIAQLGRERRAGGGGLPDALAEALDQEIERWEARAVDDPEARAVLRAFLGLRELLWEFGIRGGARREPSAPAREPARRRPRARVQRVRVEG